MIVVVADFVVGSLFESWFAKMTSGTIGRNNYICHSMSEDVLVFGSSRAIHHYDTKVLSDTLGMSCYNLGQDGCGIILSYGRLMMALNSHRPKVVICDITSYDIEQGNNIVQIHSLKPYYSQVPALADLFRDVDKTEPLKMMSRVYRYNTNYIHNPKVLLKRNSEVKYISDKRFGFKPINKKFDPMKIRKASEYSPAPKWNVDSLKLTYLQRFVDALGDDVTIVFVVSPFWYANQRYDVSLIDGFCKKNNIPFLDYQCDEDFVHNDSLFTDGTHLNSRGAEYFSKKIAHIIHKIFAEKNDKALRPVER